MSFVFGIDHTSLQARRVQARVPARIETKSELLDALDVALGFPDHFGGNWDALEECIHDLSWLDPVQVVLIHEDLPMPADPTSRRTYLSILHDAVVYWNARPEHDLVVGFPVECESAVGELMPEL